MKTCVGTVVFIYLWAFSALAGDYEVILASYGQPERIAGQGQLEDVNGWLPSMEGTNALFVELSNTHMVMADAAGNRYFADKESHSILKMTPDGIIRTAVGTHVAGNGGDTPQAGTNVALSNPNGLYVLPEGNVYILDRDNDKIRKLSTDGIVTTVITNTLSLRAGRGLWVSQDEDTMYYTASSEVRKWTSTAGVSLYANGFYNLGNIDVDPRDGNLVVTDRGTHRVYRVFPDGSREVIAGDGSTLSHGDGGPAINAGLNEVRGIAFLPHGGYFLSTQRGGDIWYVDTNHIAHIFIQGDGSSSPLPYESVCEPRAVSISPCGDLMITENDYAVLRILRRKVAISDVRNDPEQGLQISWYSMPSADYTVQFAERLSQTNWQTLAVTTGTSGEIVSMYNDTNALSKAAGFYRVGR